MTCECCSAAKESPDHRMFDPSCLWCGARYIRRMSRWVFDPTKCKERRQKVLADWMQYGHAEADLRSCAKSIECFAPDGPVQESESARPSKTKRR